VHHFNRHVALASMNMSVFKTRLLMKPIIRPTLFFLPLCNLPTFKLPAVGAIYVVSRTVFITRSKALVSD